MGDWPQVQDFNRVTITSFSPDAIGWEQAAFFTTTAGGAWPAANRAIYIPFVVHTPIIAMKMYVANGATASGNLDLGIYDGQKNRLVSKGSTAQSGTAVVQALDITDTTLEPGSYYMACAMDGTTGTATKVAPAVGLVSACGVLSQSTAFPLPDPAVWVAAQDAYIPFLAVSGRTLV